MQRLGLMFLLAAATALAQRGGLVTGGPAGGFPSGGFAFGAGLPPLAPIPTLRPLPAFVPGVAPGAAAFGFPRRFGAGFFPYIALGGYAVYPPSQNIVLVQAPPQPELRRAADPPKPAQPRIWEAPAAEDRRTPGEVKSFRIAFKNGPTAAATAVWVEDNILHYVDQEGVHWRTGLDTVDRDVTRRLNQAQNLVLRLPAAP